MRIAACYEQRRRGTRSLVGAAEALGAVGACGLAYRPHLRSSVWRPHTRV